MKAEIKYLRFQPVNGRVVAFAQLFDQKGEKLFPAGPVARSVDTTLAQVLEYVYDEDLEVTNAQDVLDTLIRVNGFVS